MRESEMPVSKREATFSEHFVPGSSAKIRKKRVDINPFCHVLIAADDRFHSRIGGNDAVTTITEIVSVFSQVQEIYKQANFDQDLDNITDVIEPLIARIGILTADTPGLW